MRLSLIAALALASGPASGGDVGPLVRALWLVQRYGTADAVDPANDQRRQGGVVQGSRQGRGAYAVRTGWIHGT